MPKHRHKKVRGEINQEAVDNIVFLMKKLGALPNLPADEVRPLYLEILEAFAELPSKQDFAEIQNQLLEGELDPSQAFTAAARLLTIPWLQQDPARPPTPQFQTKLNTISQFAHQFTVDALKRGPEFNPSGPSNDIQRQREQLLKQQKQSSSSATPAYTGRFYAGGSSDQSRSDSYQTPVHKKKSKPRGSSSSS